jgi:hypothetical protein
MVISRRDAAFGQQMLQENNALLSLCCIKSYGSRGRVEGPSALLSVNIAGLPA